MKKKLINCPLCDSKSFKLLYKATKNETDPAKLYGAASGIKGTQDIVKCASCSMIYENPRLDKNIILSGYENSNEFNHDSQYLFRVKSFYNALEKNKKHLPKQGSKILDIGTAGGAFLDAANQFGYNSFGLEPSKDLVQRGVQRGLKIYHGTIEKNNFKKKSFDMICLWDVIEHLCEPRQSLIKIKELLKDDGVLLINFPDIGTWQAKISGKYFWWILSVHLHHFSNDTLKLMTKNTGYKFISSNRYWQILQLGYLFHIAQHLKVPMAGFVLKFLPKKMREIEIPYYASQTTSIFKKI
jgi:2-polyprenyl-3-methyl-5-hydroxy-6-metoxy-1,4-benzoquinol methylase